MKLRLTAKILIKTVQTAVLNFDAGAGSFIVKGSTDKLFAAVTEGYKNNYNFTTQTGDGNADIEFYYEGY